MNNPHLVRKTTSPLSAPPEAGIHWINTATGEEYFSVGTSTVNDWIIRKNNGDWLNGNGVPSSVLGNDNDNYIDNVSGNYYKKITGSWVLQGSLKGATGSTGATGATGAPGSQIYTGSGAPSALLGVDTDFYINNVNWDYYKKIAGTWTLQGSFAAGVISVAGKVGVVTLDIADVNNLQTTLNGKEPTLTKGNLSESTSSVLTITGGANSVIGSGTSIQVKQSSATQDGYLSSTDWSNFNSSYSFIPVLKSTEYPRGFSWQNNSTTLTTDNIAAGAATGTATARSVASTNIQTKQVRSSYAVSTPAASAQCGYRSTQALFILEAGFRFKCSFGISDSQYNSGARQFYGLTATTGILGISSTITVDSLLNMIGIGSDAADTNLQIFYNDGSGVATKIDLGSSFPANRTSGAAATDWFSIEIYNAPGSSSVLYKATSYATITSQTGTLSSNLPSNTTFLSFQAIRTSGSSSNACSFDISQMYCYSPS